MIYLLEDDDSIRKLVTYTLESQGYEAMGFETPSEFWPAYEKQKPGLVLLDIMLPEQDGLSVLAEIRKTPEGSRIPVIMLTALNSEYDRVQGLDCGADDFISKPFGMMELLARIRAVLRRTETSQGGPLHTLGVLSVNTALHETKVNGENISLTHKEFSLLCLLLENRQMVLTREVIMEKIWGLGAERENRTLDVHIRTLRSKLGEAGKYIQTVRGVGYRICDT
ncbi:MAG: response regulator transcription factor [Blautia sp.]|nr:response regulator transcription factor [Blautia sp.]